MMKNFNLSIVIVVLSGLFFSSSCGSRKPYVSSSPVTPNTYNYNQNNYPRSYQQQYQPNSRSYSNPYNNPQRNYYQYYDFDQYYVPPTQYKNIEDSGYSNSDSSDKF